MDTVETWKEFDHNEITHSAAHHLMAIDDLVQRLGYARVSDVARKLDITRGSVSISLQPLKREGLIEQDENRHGDHKRPNREPHAGEPHGSVL